MSDEPALKAPRPETVTVEHDAGALKLRYRWFSTKYVFFALFCLFWDGFLVFWYGNVLRHSGPPMAFWFPLLHVAVGVGMTYWTLAGFLNRTTVLVTQGTISVQHAPLPWPGNRVVQAADIQQFYREEITRSSGRSTSVRYRLSAVTRAGPKLKLLTNDDADVVLYIEQEVEGYLGIADTRVTGEMPK